MTTKKECLIYMRTSTLTNVKGDSVKRQKSSIMKWVKSNGYSVRGEYWDVESGSKDTMDRPEFMRMISDSERMGIRVLVFSDQSRLSRDIIVQESTFRLLSSRGYSLVSSENPESFIEDSLRSIEVIAYATILFGILLYVSSIQSKDNKDQKDLNFLDSLIIGLGQCFALIPGASRSGVTMMSALFLGYKANFCAKYSFLLSIPTITAISVVEIIGISQTDYSLSFHLLLAMVISFLFAFFTISFFLKALERIGLTPFIIYRLILGFILVIFWM